MNGDEKVVIDDKEGEKIRSEIRLDETSVGITKPPLQTGWELTAPELLHPSPQRSTR